MSKLLAAIADLNDLILQGRPLEALDKYYHESIEMQENEQTPVKGLENCRQRTVEFLATLEEFQGARPLKVTVGEALSMVEWHYEYRHKKYGWVSYHQVSVQEWRDLKIVREKFYYDDIYTRRFKGNQALVVLFNLQNPEDEKAYETYAERIDAPTVRRQPSAKDFHLFKSLNLLGEDLPAPYRYIEVIPITHEEAFIQDMQSEEMQNMLRQYFSYAKDPVIITTKSII